ncbi:MAG: TIGR04211 family SH3 domain-containing protein [Acidiferrobacterales bacterium]
MLKRPCLIVGYLLFASPWVLADTAYVTDKLYVDIRADAHYESPVVHRLLSGTTLEVLEQTVDFTRVRDAQGRVGWIENRELTRDPPARLRQADVERELAKMRAQLAKTEQQLKQAQKVLAEDNADAKAVAAAQRKLTRELAGGRAKLAESRSALTKTREALAQAQAELEKTKAALSEETVKTQELASQLAAEVASQNAAPPVVAATPQVAAPTPTPAATEQVIGSGDELPPPLPPELSRWQRILTVLVALDYLWLGISFAMLSVGFLLGVVWLRQRNRRKLGGMHLRIGS